MPFPSLHDVVGAACLYVIDIRSAMFPQLAEPAIHGLGVVNSLDPFVNVVAVKLEVANCPVFPSSHKTASAFAPPNMMADRSLAAIATTFEESPYFAFKRSPRVGTNSRSGEPAGSSSWSMTLDQTRRFQRSLCAE